MDKKSGEKSIFGTIRNMNKISEEFVSNEPRRFKFKIGRHIASSLSGFIAGVIFGSIIWLLVVYLLRFF